jgi:hypothetical protein
MKLLFLLFAAFSLKAFGINPQMQNTPADARFFYFENVPNNGQTIVFTLKKVCESGVNMAPFSVEEFYSEKKQVRVVHLYGRYNQSCTKFSKNNFEQKFKLPASKKMTHVYITTDADVEVSSEQ